MTDNEIIKALECYIKENEFEYFHSNTMNEYPLIKKALNLINRQKKELEETQVKLEALLCEATGGKLSKHSYTAEVMTTQAHEHLLKCCADERAEVVKVLLDKIEKQAIPNEDDVYWVELDDIYNLVKEWVGDKE